MPAEDAPTERRPESLERDAARFNMGSQALASDGPCGELTAVIIDPVAKAVTDLVVTPQHHRGLGRLVPIDLVESDGHQIRLRCTTAEFRELDEAEEVQLMPVSSEEWSPSAGRVYSWPYYGLGVLAAGIGAGGMEGSGTVHHSTPQPLVYDRVPLGEVEVRRGESVHAADGWIGSVEGLVIDPEDHHVTHVLLAEGHLWGRKQVAIPITAASRVGDGSRVALTKEQVEDLPPVGLSSSP